MRDAEGTKAREKALLAARQKEAALLQQIATSTAKAEKKKEAAGARAKADLRVYRHEEGAHYLYVCAPFSAWRIGSRPTAPSPGSTARARGSGRPRRGAPVHQPWPEDGGPPRRGAPAACRA